MPETTDRDSGQHLWTQKDVAAYLRRSVTWVRQRTRAGELPWINMGTDDHPKPLYRPEAIRSYAEARERSAVKPNPYGRKRRGEAA